MGKKTMKTGQNKNKEVNWQVTFLQLKFVRELKKIFCATEQLVVATFRSSAISAHGSY